MKILTALIVLFLLSASLTYACTKEPQITPEVVLPTEEVTPTLEVATEPTVTLEPTPTAGQSAEVHSDGLSDGKSSCPECTKPHPAPVIPKAPSTGKGL